MRQNSVKFGSFIIACLFAVIAASPVFAASKVNTPTVKYLNNKAVTSDDAVAINDVTITESVLSSFTTSGGKVTIKLPADLTIAAGGAVPTHVRASGTSTTAYSGNSKFMALSTGVFGSSTTPHNIYLAPSSYSGGGGVLFIYHTSDGSGEKDDGSAVTLFKVWRSGAAGVSSAYRYGSGATYGSNAPLVVDFAGLSTTYNSDALLMKDSAKVGEIYFDGTQIVMTLGAKGTTGSSLETMVLEGLNVIPANTSGSGDQALTLVDGNPAGTTTLFGITGTDVTVASLVTDALKMEGAASGTSNAPPLIPGGSTVIDGQANGRIKFTVINSVSAAIDNVITLELDNGAKFHDSADETTQLAGNSTTTSLMIGSNTTWTEWAAAHGNASLKVNTAGKLVITLGTHAANDIAAQTAITIPRNATSKVIDTSGLTTSGDVTATATATGTDFDGFSGTAVIADAQLKGTAVAFKESSGATDFSTLYVGRKAQTIADGLSITESAQTSLFAGGSIIFTLDQGAKFTTADTITATKESSSTTYKDSELTLPNVSVTSASTTATSLVTSASTSAPGQYHYTSFSFDLSNATAGDLSLTVSGTAGASGTMTLCTMIEATTSSVGSSVSVVPGQSVTIPAITITENKAGALAAGKIGLKFPTGFTIDGSAASVATTISGGTSSSNVSWGGVDSGDENYAYLTVASQSQSSTGAYTIVISGLTATTASSTSSVELKIAGAASGDWTSDSSSFDSNTGAKPTAATLSLGSLVSNTVPTLSPSTGVPVNDVITQTLTAAGGNFNQAGDIYVFTTGSNAQYYDGTTWSTTEAAYESGATLGTHQIVYDVSSLGTGETVYIGYGVGYSGTAATMNTNATFAAAYTTASTVDAGKDAGTQNVEHFADDNIELYLNITNDDGVAYTDIVAEWMLLGAIINGTDWGLAFFTDQGELTYLADALAASSDLSTVTYAFDHSADTALISSLSMSSLGLTTGDQFYYGYLYSTTGFDGTDGSFVIENVTFITVK